MKRSAAAAFLCIVSACASAPQGPPPELARARAAQRVALAADHVLDFRDGLLAEALDGGRLDREDRAAAATRRIAELTLLLDRTGDLDVDASVDRDLARSVLQRAVLDLAIAHRGEETLRRLAGPATALAFLADPAPPSPATIELFAAGADGLYPDTQPADGPATASELRAAAARNRAAAHLLRTRGAGARVLDGTRAEAVRAATDAAAQRADAFAAALDKRAEEIEKAADRYTAGVGRDAFTARLVAQHGVTASPEELMAFGETLLAETERDLADLAAAEFDGRSWREALDLVRLDHATPAEIPDEALRAATDARDFTIREGFVTIPEAARLAHIEMVGDDMARSYPFAAYGWRRPTAEGESGRYMVSPGATWMDAAQSEERLRGNCRAWTRVVAAHETWPGHHLQYFVADRTVSRLRREVTTPVFVEGWGLYCEGLLHRHGYFTTRDERLARLVMRAWRAARVILDVKLHCEAMPPNDAIAFLMEHVGMPRDGAAAEVRRYCSSPTQPMSYAWGCREIERLRADEERRLGAAFDERAFHDRLLACGAIPFALVRRLFGY